MVKQKIAELDRRHFMTTAAALAAGAIAGCTNLDGGNGGSDGESQDDSMNNDSMDNESMDDDSMGNESMNNDSMDNESMGNDSMGENESMGDGGNESMDDSMDDETTTTEG